MNRLLTKIIIFAVISIAILNSAVSASPISVKAKLDSVQILMGNIVNLNMEVVQDKNVRGAFEIFKNVKASQGFVGVCGDSIELRTIYTCDTIDLGSNRIQINYKIPVQAFDSGFYQLPDFAYIAGRDTVRSNIVSLKVVPIPNLTSESPISGYADVMDPSESSIWDKLPDWLVNYWWLILLLLIVISATVFLFIRYKKKGTILPIKPAVKPFDVAISSLNNLKSRKLWENGQEREYFTCLTEILRTYLNGRFGINAMEMTTRQIEEILSQDERIKDKRDYISQVLSVADFVKFAAVRPLPEDNVKSFENAWNFVNETKPEPEEEKSNDDDGFELQEKKRKSNPQKQKFSHNKKGGN